MSSSTLSEKNRLAIRGGSQPSPKYRELNRSTFHSSWRPKGLRIDKTLEARMSLFHALGERPGITSFLQSGEDYITSLVYSPDGQTLAAGFSADGKDGGVVLWKLDTSGRPSRFPLAVKEKFVSSVAFSPDGQTIAAGLGVTYLDLSGRSRGSGGVALWDVATLKPRTATPIAIKRSIVASVTFSPDSKTVVAGLGGSPGTREHGKGGVVLLDADTGKSQLRGSAPRRSRRRVKRGLQSRWQNHRGRLRRSRLNLERSPWRCRVLGRRHTTPKPSPPTRREGRRGCERGL